VHLIHQHGRGLRREIDNDLAPPLGSFFADSNRTLSLEKYIFPLLGWSGFCVSTISAENSVCASAKLAASKNAVTHDIRAIHRNIAASLKHVGKMCRQNALANDAPFPAGSAWGTEREKHNRSRYQAPSRL
jgi:hypothetical protein